MKNKNKIILLFVLLLTVVSLFCACDGLTSGSTKNINVTFVQEGYDDVIVKVKSGDDLLEIPEPVNDRAGYNAVWDYEEDDLKNIKKAVTINIKYVAIDYTVKFVDYDDTLILEKTDYHYNDTVVLPNPPTREANNTFIYTFDGWDKEVTKVTSNVTYKATYLEEYINYAVTFVLNNGADDNIVNYHYGDKIVKPEDPTKESVNLTSYNFEYWYLDDENVEFDFENSSVESEITLNAKYSEMVRKFIIKFVDYDDTLISEKTDYDFGDTVIEPETPTREADNTYTYTFNGWDSDIETVSDDKIYKATYISEYINYTIKFVDYDDSTILEKTDYHYGDMVIAPENPTREADNTYTYTFDGWDSEVESVSGNKSYKATYTSEYIDYEVTFVLGNGEDDDVATYHYGDKIIKPEEDPIKESTVSTVYTFEYWYLDDEGVAFDFDNSSVEGEITLTAKYSETVRQYTIKFIDENGLEHSSLFDYNATPVYSETFPTAYSDTYYDYTFAWDKTFVNVIEDATYTIVKTATIKSGYSANNVTTNDTEIILGNGSIGDEANYTNGNSQKGFVHQAYFGIDGNYGLNDYITFEFTGKNMPEIAFFAKNYDDSMYKTNDDKRGVVVVSGLTDYQGNVYGSQANAVNIDGALMVQDANSGAFVGGRSGDKLKRANLVDGTNYRVIMGIIASGTSAIKVEWTLINVDTSEIVENGYLTTWNFFTGSNATVKNMTLNDLEGSIVLYGKFGTTCTVDNVKIYEGKAINEILGELGYIKYTVTWTDIDGQTIETDENVAYGATPEYNGSYPETYSDLYFDYTFGWDKELSAVKDNVTYKMIKIATAKKGYSANNVTANGTEITLGSGSIGDNANYTNGNSQKGYVRQAYFGIDGNYGLNDYVTFEFTGKNMPEIAFFAKNYDDSMYKTNDNKRGVVVVSGLTDYQGNVYGSQEYAVNIDGSLMVQDANSGAFVSGRSGTALKRANLVDGTNYRVIMGIIASGTSAIKVEWTLTNVDTNEIIENGYLTTWNFFTGSNATVKNMTLNDLEGSIVLYGKFGTTCTVKNINVYNGNNASLNEGAIVLGSGSIGDNANYTNGNSQKGYVRQAYFGIDGNYGLNDYITFEFTGKNMPEIAFFAKNYDDSMYKTNDDKRGIVVVSGLTDYQGNVYGSQANAVNIDGALMVQDANSGSFVSGRSGDKLKRANLVDGTNYRVIMGIVASGASAIKVEWTLINADTSEVVENGYLTTWNFFTGSNSTVKNMTLNDLEGSIVLYGKFGTTCTVKNIQVFEDTTLADCEAKFID